MANSKSNLWWRRLGSAVACGALIGAISIGPAFAADGAADRGSPDDSSAVNEITAAITDGPLDATLQMLQSAGVGVGSPEFRGAIAIQVAGDGQSIVLRYFKNDPNVDRLLHSIESVAGKTPLAVITEPVDYSVGAREQLAHELVTPESGVASEYGIGAPTSAWVDELTGEVSVTLAGPVPASAKLVNDKNLISIDSVPVKVLPDANVVMDFQVTRDADLPPWSGGVKLSNGSTSLSQGFVWKKWGTGEVMGSTAEHAYTETGVSTWYNNGRQVGTRYYYSVAADTTLLRSSPVGTYNPNMYFGPSNTSVRRWVVSDITTIPTGIQTALDGANGLRPAAVVTSYSFSVPSSAGTVGPVRVVDTSSCSAGDSGGPWVRTNTDGTIIGVGQHVGLVTNPSLGVYSKCAMIPQVQISAALSASIYKYTP